MTNILVIINGETSVFNERDQNECIKPPSE